MTVDLQVGDVLHWAATYDGPPFHALLSDPPYHLTDPKTGRQMTVGGATMDVRPKGGASPFAGSIRGFMGKEWDGGDIAFRPETWAAIAAHLLPGAFGMVFASSRGWHRLACAIEDAGMVIHPTIFCWQQNQGFPKATNIHLQHEKTLCEQRDDKKWYYLDDGEPIRTKPPFRHPEADKWYGHRYGLQALKPTVEPIIVFQVPYAGKPVECITATGAGALNIDGGRVGIDEVERNIIDNRSGKGWGTNQCAFGGRDDGRFESHPAGRWPANFILDEAAAAALDEQSGTLDSGGPSRKPSGHYLCRDTNSSMFGTDREDGRARTAHNDTGGASRFFITVREQLDAADPVRYVAKASRRERDAGLGEFGVDKTERTLNDGWARLESKAGTNRHGAINPHNPHPTVKPITLMRYLATLLLPPAEYAPRRIVVPFAGVGSEMIGAALAGWEDVVGIEREAEYAKIGRARLAHWLRQPALMEVSA